MEKNSWFGDNRIGYALIIDAQRELMGGKKKVHCHFSESGKLKQNIKDRNPKQNINDANISVCFYFTQELEVLRNR